MIGVEWVWIINLNIIYILKNSHIWRGNLSKGRGGGSMRPYHQNSTVCIKSFYCIPLVTVSRYQYLMLGARVLLYAYSQLCMVHYNFNHTLPAGGIGLHHHPSASLWVYTSTHMKFIADPRDVYQLAIPNFDMHLAEISNYTLLFHITIFSHITQMVFTGTFYFLIFNDLFIQNPAIHTNIVQYIVGQQCLCKQQKPKESEVLQGCSLSSIQHNKTRECAKKNMNDQRGACTNNQYLNL
jgi:hypothetical protein